MELELEGTRRNLYRGYREEIGREVARELAREGCRLVVLRPRRGSTCRSVEERRRSAQRSMPWQSTSSVLRRRTRSSTRA